MIIISADLHSFLLTTTSSSWEDKPKLQKPKFLPKPLISQLIHELSLQGIKLTTVSNCAHSTLSLLSTLHNKGLYESFKCISRNQDIYVAVIYLFDPWTSL